jgi:hypothetical protein
MLLMSQKEKAHSKRRSPAAEGGARTDSLAIKEKGKGILFNWKNYFIILSSCPFLCENGWMDLVM